MEGHGKFWGGGSFNCQNCLHEGVKLNWNFQRVWGGGWSFKTKNLPGGVGDRWLNSFWNKQHIRNQTISNSFIIGQVKIISTTVWQFCLFIFSLIRDLFEKKFCVKHLRVFHQDVQHLKFCPTKCRWASFFKTLFLAFSCLWYFTYKMLRRTRFDFCSFPSVKHLCFLLTNIPLLVQLCRSRELRK